MAYTTIDDPSAHFQIKLYTGTGSAVSFTNDGNSDLQPDLVWIKQRSATQDHALTNSNIGAGNFLASNTADGNIINAQMVTSFDTDGFSLGTNGLVNASAGTYVAWQWVANGGTTSSITEFNINSTVQVNSTAGFSIVQYTGTSATSNSRVGHGLGNVARKDILIFTKCTGTTGSWSVAHPSNAGTDADKYLVLNSAAAEATSTNFWGDEEAGNGFFEVKDGGGANNVNNESMIAFVFKQIQGFSKFGKYVGNGSLTSGPFVYTGFKPAFVMIKAIDAVKNWVMLDNKRLGYNGGMYFLYANTDAGEGETPSSGGHIDLLSNGFKIYDNWSLTNQNTVNYTYMAFAENPFVSSTGIPTTAR